MANGWTSERRAQQAQAIRRWRPWEHATGPRTADGKARSARNADRGGQRRQWREMIKALNGGMRTQRQATKSLQHATTIEKRKERQRAARERYAARRAFL
jgi:hypothetical protein